MSSERVISKPAARVAELPYPLARWRPRVGLVVICLLLVATYAMHHAYISTQREVTLSVDGYPLSFRTHQTSVDAFLEEIGVEVNGADIVLPGLHTDLDDQVIIERAKPVILEVDGQTLERYTHSKTVGDFLLETGVALGPHDRITMKGVEVSLEAPLSSRPISVPRGVGKGKAMPLSLNPPSTRRIVIYRSIPFQLFDDGVLTTLSTIAPTVGEALKEHDVLIYLGDGVKPGLGTPLSTGMRVYIERAKPLTILVDGRRIVTRTQAERVKEALEQEGVIVGVRDYTTPHRLTPLTDNMTVQVIRVKEGFAIEEESIPFETVWRPDSELEIDHRRLAQPGEEGLRRRLIRIRYENDQEKERVMTDEWVAKEPTTEVIAYGTKIVVRELETPEGTIRYWRKIRMLATSYTAATSGKSRDDPRYGITYLGWKATKGVIAVDPTVINLGTKMYVPGYGFGTAADTGGAIKGRHIDLAYDEGNLVLWFKWVDVY
ncbi:MAG: ubiquitin-like domain-containing protein, partial [Anaerolineae bacterium]